MKGLKSVSKVGKSITGHLWHLCIDS